MKLIIDIPEKNFIKDDLMRYFGCYSPKLDEVIKNGIPLDDIETLKHRSYLEGFHKAYQMYYKMFDDIKAEIQASMDMYKGCEYIGDKARRDELWHVLEIIDKHIRKERMNDQINGL